MTKGSFNLPIQPSFSQYSHIALSWDNTQPDPAMSSNGSLHDYWKQVKLVTLADNGSENSTIATFDNPLINGDTDGTDGQVMVKLPRLWYNEGFDANSYLNSLDISSVYQPGYTLHPCFTWGNGRSHIYVGAYEASLESGSPNKLASVSGAAIHANIDLASFRTLAVARGGGTQNTSKWHLMGFYTQHLLDLLFYAWYKNRDAKTVLPGYIGRSSWADANRRNTGRSNGLTTINGVVPYDPAGTDSDLGTSGWEAGFDRNIATRFLFIENPYGHIWKMNDGVAYDGRTTADKKVYATPDPRQFSSVEATILSSYDDLGEVEAILGDDYLKQVRSLFLPSAYDADSNTYWSSYYWNRLTDSSRNYLRLVRAGSRLIGGALAGVACRNVALALGYAHASVGARLCFSDI